MSQHLAITNFAFSVSWEDFSTSLSFSFTDDEFSFTDNKDSDSTQDPLELQKDQKVVVL